LSFGRAPALRDCGEVDVSVVDAIEDVGEDGRRKGKTDVHQLRVAVAGGFDRGEIVIADSAARLRERADKKRINASRTNPRRESNFELMPLRVPIKVRLRDVA
jgi:hypothetical protein